MWKTEATVTLLDNPLWTIVFPISQKIGDAILEQRKDRRIICRFKDYSKNCALMHDGSGGYFVMINKRETKKLHLQPGDTCVLTLEIDNSRYGMPMPEAFQAAINTDPDGENYFEALTPGKKRSLLYMVEKVKNEELRINKSLIILEHLKRQGGKVDYKVLQQDFRREKG